MGARRALAVRGTTDVMEVLTNFRRQIVCFVGAVRFEKFAVIADRLPLLDGLAHVVADFPASG